MLLSPLSVIQISYQCDLELEALKALKETWKMFNWTWGLVQQILSLYVQLIAVITPLIDSQISYAASFNPGKLIDFIFLLGIGFTLLSMTSMIAGRKGLGGSRNIFSMGKANVTFGNKENVL